MAIVKYWTMRDKDGNQFAPRTVAKAVYTDETATETLDVGLGNRTYTEQNVVTSGESITKSIDKLDNSLEFSNEYIINFKSVAASNSFEFTDLNLIPGNVYELFVSGRNTSISGTSLAIEINNNTSETNYSKQGFISNGTTNTGTRTNSNTLIFSDAGNPMGFVAKIWIDAVGGQAVVNISDTNRYGSLGFVEITNLVSTFTANPITKLKFTSNNNLQPGVVFKLRKVF